MAATAVLLIDVQNEFFSPGGKLRPRVKYGMQKNEMGTKLPQLVNNMRKRGSRIIHAIIDRKDEEDERTKLHEADFFKEGTWNAEIPKVITPAKNDVILGGRNNYSAFQGTELQSILQWERIQKLYIAGFLTNVCILETVREAHDLGLIDEGLQIFVVKDCCAAESVEQHDYAVNYSLPSLCKTITSRQVLKSISMNIEETVGKEADKAVPEKGNGIRPSLHHSHHLVSFAWNRTDFRWRSYLRYGLFIVLLQIILGQDYIFTDGRPACDEASTQYGGQNYNICTLEYVLRENYGALSTVMAFILAGFISYSVSQWKERRSNYCTVCGANRNLILQISSLVPCPSPDDDNYEEVKQERETMERWAVLGYEIAFLKAKGMMDSAAGRAHLESLGLLEVDEWDKMVAGDRHTTVWYWIQQKAVYLTEQGTISSEIRLQTICQAVTEMRAKANDLMSVIDRDIPNAYTFVVGMLVHLTLSTLALAKGFGYAIVFYDSHGKIYRAPAMWADLFLTIAIFVSLNLLYDIAFILYNPFHERLGTDDVPHRIVSSGIRHLAESLGEAKHTRPSTMFWMKSQEKDLERLGLRYKRTEGRRNKLFKEYKANKSKEDLVEFIEYEKQAGSRRNLF